MIIGEMLGILISAGIILAVIAAALYYLFFVRGWKLNLLIIEYRGGYARLRFTKGKRVISEGKEFIQRRDNKDIIPPFGYTEAIVDNKGRTWYVFVEYGPMEYAPAYLHPSHEIEIEIPTQREDGTIVRQKKTIPIMALVPRVDPGYKMAYAEAIDLRDKLYKKENFLEKYGNWLIIAALFLLMVVGFQMIAGVLGEIAKTLAPGLDKLAEAINKLTELIKVMKPGVQTPPPPPA